MAKYAESTSVPVERSKAEIERTLLRYGAGKFVTGWDQSSAMVGFEMSLEQGVRQVRFSIALPDPQDDEFALSPAGRTRSDPQRLAAYEQACRQRWRALALVIKAKLEAVETGITTFEDEFMPFLVLPGGGLVRDEVLPRIAEAYASGTAVPLLPDYSGKRRARA